MHTDTTGQFGRVIVALWRTAPNGGIEFFVPSEGTYLEYMSLRVGDMRRAAASARAWLLSEWNVTTRTNARSFVREIDGVRVVAIAFGLSSPEQRPLSALGSWLAIASLMATRHPGLPASLMAQLSIELGGPRGAE